MDVSKSNKARWGHLARRWSVLTEGVKFKHYDMHDTVRAGDAHVSGDLKGAWFKDLDGSIRNLASR
jgi:hypothetical protein